MKLFLLETCLVKVSWVWSGMLDPLSLKDMIPTGRLLHPCNSLTMHSINCVTITRIESSGVNCPETFSSDCLGDGFSIDELHPTRPLA